MEFQIDKSSELEVSLELMNQKLHFSGNVDSNDPISIDYYPPYGDNLGYTSLELLLLSLASCYGSALVLLLRKMGKSVGLMGIRSRGIRKQEHPTGFSQITIDFNIETDANGDEIDKVLRLAEERYCPVYDMVKGNVEIVTGYTIIKGRDSEKRAKKSRLFRPGLNFNQ
jgi:putative redox protein